MTNDHPVPPPMQPPMDLSYFSAPTLPPRRPSGVTPIAWISVILGGLAFVGLPFSLLFVLFIVPRMPSAPHDPAFFYSDPLVLGHTLFSQVYSMIMSIILFLGGLFFLQSKPLGRRLLLVYARISLVLVAPMVLFAWFFYFPPLVQIVASHPH